GRVGPEQQVGGAQRAQRQTENQRQNCRGSSIHGRLLCRKHKRDRPRIDWYQMGNRAAGAGDRLFPRRPAISILAGRRANCKTAPGPPRPVPAMQEVSAPMKTTVKRTLLGAALLAALAAVLPFLCLVPLFAPEQAGSSGQAADPDTAEAGSQTESAAATAAPTAEPRAEPQAILLWDEAQGQAVSVPAREYMMGAAACEMPMTWPDAALQAQMVASHSWALYQLAHSDAAGTAITVNSDQCSGWTTQAVLQSRWGDEFDAN